MVPDFHSIAILFAMIVLSVSVTLVTLYLMKLIREKHSRRKYR